jgi:F420-dependent oxidoreductase-like protein
MKIGLQVPGFTYPEGPTKLGSKLSEIAHTADDGGFSSIWVMDHFFQIGQWLGPAENEMLESYSTLSYLAGLTKKVKLGALVTGVVYRHPGVLIKTVTTLDVLSGGRAYYGVGAAWNAEESAGLGIPFPPVAERFERLEETLKIAQQMWSTDDGEFTGKHYQLARTLNSPQPISKPHPPILIGGMGEQKTLKLVAKYADACNMFAGMGIDTLTKKLDVLKKHCEAIGRDFAAIEKTALDTVHLAAGQMNPTEVIERCRVLANAGVQHTIFNMPNVHEITPLEIFGKEIIPAVKAF